MELKIGDKVRALVDTDFIDRIDTSKPHEVFNLTKSPEDEDMVGIKCGDYWYYVKTSEVKHWN